MPLYPLRTPLGRGGAHYNVFVKRSQRSPRGVFSRAGLILSTNQITTFRISSMVVLGSRPVLLCTSAVPVKRELYICSSTLKGRGAFFFSTKNTRIAPWGEKSPWGVFENKVIVDLKLIMGRVLSLGL